MTSPSCLPSVLMFCPLDVRRTRPCFSKLEHTHIRSCLAARHTDPEPKIWAASPDENTPWGPNQAVRSIPRGHVCDGGAATQLVPAPSYNVAMDPQSSGDPVSCVPRQRTQSPVKNSVWSPRAPPGRPKSQLEPPDSLTRQRGLRISAKLCRVKTFQYVICQCCRGLYYRFVALLRCVVAADLVSISYAS
jgi:hypothetical protein